MTDVAFDNSLDSRASDHGFDPPAKNTSIWQDETIYAYVRKLWEDHSASEICAVLGKELGIAVGRNAIVGWLRRQKLTAEHKTKFHPLTKCTIAPRARTRPRREPKPEGLRPKQGFGQPFVMRCAEVDPRHIPILQLTESTCKFPYGDVGVGEGVTYCGHAPLKGLPYCGPHWQITHKGPQ